ncbi:Cytidine monophosphate kinase [Alteracholeplasma palmae J233]|uniref:Cytidylate kinase n=1 Tax=Alteracholeplasma palmae (strain ATCC 49389 / J233) TaxID=1318466 RepID=U4KKU7_ALTPJ|nr:(d)CMP kinase [Alteracholeplasma palmae]CCV64303.1 Cytidine monophosphate kinase [Alteracholeplasma palmae J233]
MGGFKLAIDGPAGSGKSTISSLLAKKLGWTHIDTGAMYRAVTLYALNNKVNLEDETSYKFLENIKIEYKNNRIYIDNVDVSEDIRNEQINKYVSLVSSFSYVRKKLVEIQKETIQNGNIIMDGRDIGTVVIPEADLKLFLTAHVEERAKRRHKEQKQKGDVHEINQVIEEIKLRDSKDSTRKESPLRKASDAIEFDTTNYTIDQVVDKIIELIKSKEQ